MKKFLILLSSAAVLIAAGILLISGMLDRALPVTTVAVELASLNRSIHTNGKIEAADASEIRASASGICRTIAAGEGAVMKKGQVILRIEDPSLQADLASAQAELEAAEVDLRNVRRGPAPEELAEAESGVERARIEFEHMRGIFEGDQRLLEKEAITRFEVEQARQNLTLARQELEAAGKRLEDIKSRYGELDRRRAAARLKAAQEHLGYLRAKEADTVVRAPGDGTLYQCNVRKGAYLNTGDLIGLFADLSHLRLRAFVDEPDFGQIHPGEKVRIGWDARPDMQWEGTVTSLPAQVVALGTRSVAEVLCAVEDPQGILIANINVDVAIMTPEGPKVASLPREVVFPEGDREFVWSVQEGRARKKYIETGRSTVSRIEIIRGLSINDPVIDPGDQIITSGMKIKVGTE